MEKNQFKLKRFSKIFTFRSKATFDQKNQIKDMNEDDYMRLLTSVTNGRARLKI